jgi:hypothetical protein
VQLLQLKIRRVRAERRRPRPPQRHHRPPPPLQSWSMKPHARKKDRHALARVSEVAITSSRHTNQSASPCAATHAAPAVVFSAGGYAGNMFHVLTDVLVPLFVTTRRFGGDAHLLVRDAQPWWLDRYGPLLPPRRRGLGQQRRRGLALLPSRGRRARVPQGDERG